MHSLIVLTMLLTMISGVIMLALGQWHLFKLKFAAVALSTITAAWLSYNAMIRIGWPLSCKEADLICMQAQIFYIVRNLSILLFQIACGRDAIHFKRFDRRVARVQSN